MRGNGWNVAVPAFILGFMAAVIAFLVITLAHQPEPREPAICKPVTVEQYKEMVRKVVEELTPRDLTLLNQKYCLTP